MNIFGSKLLVSASKLVGMILVAFNRIDHLDPSLFMTGSIGDDIYPSKDGRG